MAYVINDNCVACGSCISECPVEAISEGDIYKIDADKCLSFVLTTLSTKHKHTGKKIKEKATWFYQVAFFNSAENS